MGYQYDGYSGTEEYFDKDTIFLDNDNFGRSVIVTGCDPWTLYKDDNYDGASLCLYPSDTSNCYPSFFLQKDIGWIADQISSVRRGCHSQNILQTIQPPPETEELET